MDSFAVVATAGSGARPSGAPADIDTLKQQNLTLELHIVDLRLQLQL